MRIEDFDFELPEGQIAQAPLPARDASRLMVVRGAGELEHCQFRDLPALLRRGDLLVVNDARVIPARLLGKKAGTGGKVELLLLRPAASSRPAEALSLPGATGEWICLGQASKGLKPGAVIELEAGVGAEIVESLGGGEYRVRFSPRSSEPLEALLERAGRLPLPPYITREPTAADAERYQTVYASAPGSVAAPTAGLHFTPELFASLEAAGIARVSITLDVGAGTFLPVRESELDRHRMHAERYCIGEQAATAIAQARAEGRRVVAVGTTVVRSLEAAAQRGGGEVRAGEGETDLFIRPGHRFQVVDVLLTNFHLPRSTLIVLVSAFLGRERTLSAYREAVAQGYRFFSYGDAMLVIP